MPKNKVKRSQIKRMDEKCMNLQPETIFGIVLFTLLFAGTMYALKKGSQVTK